MQPVLTQVPPNLSLSTMTTLSPAPASRVARDGPTSFSHDASFLQHQDTTTCLIRCHIEYVVAGFSPRFHNVVVLGTRAKARDYITRREYLTCGNGFECRLHGCCDFGHLGGQQGRV